MRHIRAAPPTPSASLRAVEARAARQAAQDRGPARRVRLGFTVADSVPVRNCFDRVGEDGEAFIKYSSSKALVICSGLQLELEEK